MIKIYCIEDINGLKYIGSTKRTLAHRLSQHKSFKSIKKYSSRELNLDDCRIYTLEECEEEQRKEREQYWINHTECVNKRNTIFDKKEYDKEYHLQNKDKRNKQNNNNYQKNKDKIKQYRKNNRDKLLKQMKNNYHYKNSWAGDPRYHNNLLKIDLNIFL